MLWARRQGPAAGVLHTPAPQARSYTAHYCPIATRARRSDFHTYRGYRTKELARLHDFEEERKEATAEAAWEQERAERAAEVEGKAAKRAAKRQRQKEAKKAKSGDGDSSEAPAAADVADASAA